MSKATKRTPFIYNAEAFEAAAKSASNVLGLRPVQVGTSLNAAETVDNIMEVVLTSGRKFPRVATTSDGKVVLASRPTIKRNGWKPVEGGKNRIIISNPVPHAAE